MKRMALVFILLLSVVPASPSNAIFGLSKCERVKKQVIKLEEAFSQDIGNLYGDYYLNPIKNFSGTKKIFILEKDSSNAINRITSENKVYKIWKLAYNNPKCFTRTQEIQIGELRKISASNFVSQSLENIYSNEGKCKKLMASWLLLSENGYDSRERKCFIRSANILINNYSYKSIYKY